MTTKQRLRFAVTNNVVNPEDPPPDDPVPGAPAAPTGFTANPSLTTVALDWANNTELDLAGYKVYRFVGGTWSLLQTVTAPTSAYTATGLTGSTSYSFRVTAYDATGLESTPASLTVTTDPVAGAPAAPTGFTANPATTSVALDWANNTETDLAGYKVYRLIGATWWLMQDVTAPTSAYTVPGLAASTTCTFHVTAYSTAGFESVPSVALTVTTDPAAPAAPTGFVANPDLTSVALDWNANTEPDLASYKVYRLIGGVWTLIHTVTAPTSTYTVTGLSPSTTYVFRITAFTTHSLESVPSNALTVTTDSQTTGDTLATFDRTGTTDIADALEAWLNDNANVPNGTGAATPTRIKFPQFQADGVTRAIYRNEGGITGGVNLNNMVDITLDGGGRIGGRGLDGAQFISKTKIPFVVQADPTANPRGFHLHLSSTINNVPPWLPGTNYALNAVVSSAGRRYKSRVANNVGHDPTDTTTGSTFWLNTGPDGFVTVTTGPYDFVARGVQVGDRIQVLLGVHATKDTRNCGLVHNSNIISVPAGSFTTKDNGALVECAAAGFPPGPMTLTYVDATHIAIDDYYTGVSGSATITTSLKTSTQSTRTITSVTPKTVTYNGSSMGVGTVDFVINPASQWNVFYTPTSAIATSFTGSYALSTYAFDQALKRAFDLNRARSMFVCTKNTRQRFRGFQFTASYPFVYDPTLATSGYDPDYESQDAIVQRGCRDWAVQDCTIEKFWGNGVEQQPFVESDGSYTATIGGWINRSKLQNFGRQSLSLTYGGFVIVDGTTYLGESSRSLIDCEPTTSRVDSSLDYTMQGVYLLGCQIGYHRLGMLSMHEGLGYVLVKGCSGRAIGSSGAAVVDYCIFEDNVETPSDLSDYSLIFNSGVRKGGNNIIVRNNAGMTSRIAGVHFNADNGPCRNFQVVSNLFGTGIPQFADDGGTNGLPFTPFTLPIPHHALRDLEVTPPNTTAPTNVVAQPLRGGVACSWTPPTAPNSFDWYELSVYGVISGTPTPPPLPNSPTSHSAKFPRMTWVTTAATWGAITGASNADSSGWVNTMFDTAHGGFADTYVCRVRGYDVATGTFGPYSEYSNPVTPSATTGNGTYITGAQHPDGTPIGIPGGTALTPFAGNYNAVSGTITANKFTQPITITGPTTLVNSLVTGTGIIDHVHSTNISGTMIHNPSAFVVTTINCEINALGPGHVNAGIDWANFNLQKTIIHGTDSFGAYGGGGCNITLDHTWIWDLTGHSIDVEQGPVVSLTGHVTNGSPIVTIGAGSPGSFATSDVNRSLNVNMPGMPDNTHIASRQSATQVTLNNAWQGATSTTAEIRVGGELFAHRDCIVFFGDSAGPSTITSNVLELHSDQNAVVMAQSSQGAITRTNHVWNFNWIDGGGGRALYISQHSGDPANAGHYQVKGNHFRRAPDGFWSHGSFAGTPTNPAVLDRGEAPSAVVDLGTPDTNQWVEPGFVKPIGV